MISYLSLVCRAGLALEPAAPGYNNCDGEYPWIFRNARAK
jgi:hypothetical protein